MRLNQQTDYSLRVLIFLALSKGRLATIKEISDAYGTSKNHLMKVVQQLVRTGYIESTRGHGGGLRLKSPASEIVIGEVVRQIEPDVALVECLKDESGCIISPACKLHEVFIDARTAFFDHLDTVTLADLLPSDTRASLIDLLEIER